MNKWPLVYLFLGGGSVTLRFTVASHPRGGGGGGLGGGGVRVALSHFMLGNGISSGGIIDTDPLQN